MLLAMDVMSTGCAPDAVFSPEVTRNVDRNFQFKAWRSLPTIHGGKKVQVGGRIIEARVEADHTIIAVSELPIVARPTYGPKETRKSHGQFAITFPEVLEAKWREAGNRLVVVGPTTPFAWRTWMK